MRRDLGSGPRSIETWRQHRTRPHDPSARTVGPDATVEQAACLLSRYRIGRLPIIDPTAHRLLGIVTRSDLLGVHRRADEEIRAQIENEVLPQVLRLDSQHFTVHVRSGVVTILGHVDRRSVVPARVEVTGHVEGVLRVTERIDDDVDDRLPASAVQWGGRM
ncbi:CBS domain-containing protein [Nonomuraea sp. NBC_00507]|uniref:CBS domain-containing protein n=1 Tax=Nonomuraea sp. NBC_00507 TaxID=2976002 RepID=UPI002E17908D